MPINRTPPAGVVSAAKRGLRLYDEGKGGDGLKAETVRRARSIAAGEAQSIRWLTVEAPAWFARHDETRPAEVADSPWQVAWLLWGGDAGRRWAEAQKAKRGRMEAAGETVMSLTIPTAEGQGLGEFLDELEAAVRARLAGLIPPAQLPIAEVSVESDSITASDCIAEVCIGEDERYYRLTYQRDDAGRIVLGEPEAVREVTTYEPASDAVAMSAIICDMQPVHAPPAEGLTRGRMVQLMRVGPLHDAMTGEHLLDVTDELLASIVAGAGIGFAVPVDFGHALYHDQSAGGGGNVELFGRIVGLEHRKGDGLYGVPEWTAAGAAKLSEMPGLLYLSPTLLGTAHDPTTGKPAGRMLHSVSLTPRPRQDSLASLALAERTNPGAGAPTKGTAMADKTGNGAPKPESLTLAEAQSQIATLLAERDAVKAQLDAAQADRVKAEAEAVTLSQRIGALEADAHKRAVAEEIRGYEAKGHIIPDALKAKALSMDAESRAICFSATATRAVVALGHGAVVEAPDAVALAIAETNKRLDALRKGVV